MKAIIWSAFLFFSAIWTGGVALAIALIRAAVDFIRPVEGAAASGVVVQPPIPDWLAPWADLLGWREWIQWATALLESLLALLPALGQSLDCSACVDHLGNRAHWFACADACRVASHKQTLALNQS